MVGSCSGELPGGIYFAYFLSLLCATAHQSYMYCHHAIVHRHLSSVRRTRFPGNRQADQHHFLWKDNCLPYFQTIIFIFQKVTIVVVKVLDFFLRFR